MKESIIFVLLMILACQPQKKNTDKTEKAADVAQSTTQVASKSASDNQQENIQCNADVCLQFRNHDASNKSFDIFMANSASVFGFQCDLPGIKIVSSDGGLLQENEYQTSNSDFRILSFSMQARPIPIGEGVLTTIYYSEPTKEVCMTEIIFAGIGGTKLENDIPECLQLN